jgi:hypothetical protein
MASGSKSWGLRANSEKVLPVPSNKKHNKHVKEIANICGIKKKMTTQNPRHNTTTLTVSNDI